MNDREAAEILFGSDRIYEPDFDPEEEWRSGADIAESLAAFFGLTHERYAVIARRRALRLIGYDRSIVQRFTGKLHVTAAALGSFTRINETRRGATFDVRVPPGSSTQELEPEWGVRVLRVTVEMIPYEDEPQ